MDYKTKKDSFHQSSEFQPLSYKLLLELFPFCLILNEDMHVVSCGVKFNEIWRGKKAIYDQPITNYFRLRRPKGIAFSWKNVSSFIQICIFKALHRKNMRVELVCKKVPENVGHVIFP